MKLILLSTLLSLSVYSREPKFVFEEQVYVKSLLKRLDISVTDKKFYRCSNLTRFMIISYDEQFLSTSCKWAYQIEKINNFQCSQIPKLIKLCEDSLIANTTTETRIK